PPREVDPKARLLSRRGDIPLGQPLPPATKPRGRLAPGVIVQADNLDPEPSPGAVIEKIEASPAAVPVAELAAGANIPAAPGGDPCDADQQRVFAASDQAVPGRPDRGAGVTDHVVTSSRRPGAGVVFENAVHARQCGLRLLMDGGQRCSGK